MKSEDDDRPKRKVTHEIGQDLYALSAGDLAERVAMLNAEIARLHAEIAKKNSSRDAAANAFKK